MIVDIKLIPNLIVKKYDINIFGITMHIKENIHNAYYDKEQLVALAVKIKRDEERRSFIECIKEKLNINVGTMQSNVMLNLADIIQEVPDIINDYEDCTAVHFRFKPEIKDALFNHDIHSLMLF